MYVLLNMWFQSLMRQFFFNVDKIIFGLISKIYDLLLLIARTSPLSQADIADMAGRVYKLLAIFMIFKVTFSLIMYVVNPDDFTEKGKGISKLTINIVLSLALLILTPYFFSYAYQFQKIILEDNSLATLIFGKSVSSRDQNAFSTAGDKMAYIAMSPFFVPDTSISNLHSCITMLDEDKINEECFGISSDNYMPVENNSASLYSLTRKNNKADSENPNFKLVTLQNYAAGINNKNIGLAFRQDMALATDSNNEVFIMDYSYICSTAIGVCVALLLLTYCMDIAVRSIKLAFLQLIAPVPIISYIDPKSGKDGLFKKWYKMCFSTYISLFVRLLVLYFVVYIVDKIGDGKLVDIVDGAYVTGTLLSAFILIGALMFAKQFPEILKGLGIKLDGGGKFTLNPLKKFEEEAIGGKKILGASKAALGAAGAIGAGTLASSIGAFGKIRSRWNETDKKDRWKLIGAGVTSGLSTGFRAGIKGLGGVVKGEKGMKNFTNSYKSAMSGEKTRFDRVSDGVGIFSVAKTNVEQSLGMRTKQEKLKLSEEKYKQANEKYKAAKDNIVAADYQAKALNEQLKILEATSIDRMQFYERDADGNFVLDPLGNPNFREDDYKAAVEKLAADKKKLGDDIDSRVKSIMNGTADVEKKAGEALETNTEYVRELARQITEEANVANAMAKSIDDKFKGANVDPLDSKATAKGSQTASSAIGSTAKGRKVSAAGKYTKNNDGKK